jgi:hypothetical protein
MVKHPQDDYRLPWPAEDKWCDLHGRHYYDYCHYCGEIHNPLDVTRHETLPDNNPKTRVGGANKVPLHLVPPTAIAHMAMGFADGGGKYQPYNWRAEPISASVYYGAARRHLDAWWEGEDYAEDSNVHHLAHAMCCMAMILDTMGRPGGLNDNRPPPSDYSALLDLLAARLPALRDRPTTKFDLHDTARAEPFAAQVERELGGAV